MDATHPFETQDLQIADLVEREGRALVFVLAKWDLVEDPQAKLAELLQAAHRVDGIVKGLKQPDWPHDGWGALHRLAQMLCALCIPAPAGV
jgi:hypothetical protein